MTEEIDYMHKLSEMSDRYGSLLIKLMDAYGARNLQQISQKQAKEFYEKELKNGGNTGRL